MSKPSSGYACSWHCLLKWVMCDYFDIFDFGVNSTKCHKWRILAAWNCVFLTAGWYMFIETSSPRVHGEKARYISPPVIPHGPKCLEFYYHMYGAHVDTLNMYVKTSQALNTPVWTKTGTQGTKWNLATVQITASVIYRVGSRAKISIG
jgi:hypothetical protein